MDGYDEFQGGERTTALPVLTEVEVGTYGLLPPTHVLELPVSRSNESKHQVSILHLKGDKIRVHCVAGDPTFTYQI